MKKSLIFSSGVILLVLYISAHNNNVLLKDINFKLHCPPSPSFTDDLKGSSINTDDKNISEDWKDGIEKKIGREEYNITYSEKLKAFQSPNRANNIRFIYHNDGFTAVPRDAKCETPNVKRETNEEWSLRLRITNYDLLMEDTGETLLNTKHAIPNSLQVSGNSAFIENENIRIDYLNNEEGMRQDFIVMKKPEGEGKLKLQLTAETKLKMIIGANALVFKSKSGEEKMRYSALKCWDANGRELRAYFEKNSELGIRNYELGINTKELKDNSKIQNLKSEIDTIPNSKFLIPNSFEIVVNDENAVYPITIDPLSSSYSWIKGGPQVGAHFGFSVSTAGDVNGDGYSDVIIGAYDYDNGSSSEGLAQVYYGSAAGLSTTHAWSQEGNESPSFFGWSVSTAGDVNGDGYSDVIVGARFHNVRYGAAFVYHGSDSGLSTTANWSRSGQDYNGYFGHCVSTAGDVNGDGYSDVIVSAIYEGPSLDGRVFLYKGSSAGLSNTAAQTLTGPHYNCLFGNTISLAGDVNGDGYSDIIVGTPHFTNTESLEGKAFIFKGENTAAGINPAAVWEVESNIGGSRFGYSVASAGDVNGDGYSDVVIGSYTYSNGQADEGRVQLFYGNSSGGSTTAAWDYESDYTGAKLGASVQTAGDVNGDGYADIIAGAPEYSNNQTQEGRAYVFFGSSSGPSTSFDWAYEDNTTNAWLGFSVCTAGDINGDGFSDVIAGGPQVSVGGAFVFNGYAAGLASSANWSEENNQASSQLGYSVSIAGDVNGDGYSDVIVGAPLFDNDGADRGKVYVYLGSSSGLSTSADWTKDINEDSSQFGSVVETAGDINGDGFSDVIVSAPYFDGNSYINQGRVWVYNGSSTGLSSSASWFDNGEQDGARFGSDASTAGDVNGDGYSDIIVGSDLYDNGESDEGKVFVYYGSSSGLTNYPVWTSEGNQVNAHFGTVSAAAGDVNGDKYSDLIIGAPDYSNGQNKEGCVFIFLGSASGLPSGWNTLLEKDQSDANFGISCHTAGDVNGDSYSDIVVGANLFDNGENAEGAAFIYHGSSAGLSVTPARTLERNQESAHFGEKVSNAGDVNGDGYSDVIISAPDFDSGQNNEGKVFLYYGSPSGIPNSPEWSDEPNQANSDFGGSISTSGDVNGDGYSDIIIGSPRYDNGQTDEGNVFVFYGNLSTCKRANTRQFESGTNNVICSGNNTGEEGTVKLQLFANNPFGRSDGRLVFERKRNGLPFSGSVITNSTENSGTASFTDLTLNGKNISDDLSGLNSSFEYKWRARVQYRFTNNPYQKFGPWKYFTNYVPVPFGDFKPMAPAPAPSLTLTAFIQGFYNAATDEMVRDTVIVFVRQFSSPYGILDSAKFYLSNLGSDTKTFTSPVVLNGVMYFLQLSHRNSIETWNTGSAFVNGTLIYDFGQSAGAAFGGNQIQVDASPLRYAIFSGDVNQDGVVDGTDGVLIDNDAANFNTGYLATDLNGDEIIDGSDAVIADNNAANFVSKIIP